MLRLGQIGYINALPLFLGITSGEVSCDAKLITGVPAELNRQQRDGRLDLSLVSCVEYLEEQARYELLLPLGIAACGEVRSVLLHVRGEWRDGMRIALTGHSAASARLVEILCRHYWHVEPEFSGLLNLDDHSLFDAFLLIGDEALLQPEFAGYRAIDLAGAWYDFTGLPAVFAVLAARREVVEEAGDEVAELQQQLRASLIWGKSHLDQVVAEAKRRVDLPEEQLYAYYDLLRYELREAELQGLNRFSELCAIGTAA